MLNQRVVLMTGTMELSAKGERVLRRSTIPFRIVDIMFTGVYLLDSSFVYVPLEVLQKELYPREKGRVATSINIKLKPGVDPDCGRGADSCPVADVRDEGAELGPHGDRPDGHQDLRGKCRGCTSPNSRSKSTSWR